MKKGSMEFHAVQADFERYAKQVGNFRLDREVNAPSGYWYQNQDANIAFKWFLHGYEHAKCLARQDDLPLTS